MPARLLQEFFEDDGRQLGQRALLAFIAEVPAMGKRQFNFNRFDLLVDREKGEVVLEDVLDGSPAGSCRVLFSEFVRAIEAMRPNA